MYGEIGGGVVVECACSVMPRETCPFLYIVSFYGGSESIPMFGCSAAGLSWGFLVEWKFGWRLDNVEFWIELNSGVIDEVSLCEGKSNCLPRGLLHLLFEKSPRSSD